MSTRKRVKSHQNLYKQIGSLSSAALKGLMKWLLRSLLVIIRRTRRRARLSKSGFVLPTVVMVSLVVILLTTALMLRSFDRSKNASNVRVNQAVLNAATPALNRARAKIDEVFKDPTLSRAALSDTALYNALTINTYTFGDETRLKLVHDIDKSRTIQGNTAAIENNETLTTAWKFPVDTDNNGLFDSFTLYGIYFRSPTRGADGKLIRARNPLEARTPPMDEGDISGQCATALGTSDRLLDNSSWYKSGNKLTKSFFVYTATVPITEINNLNTTQYEQYKGNRGFSALELQQDQARIPLNNHAVWYEDDIEVSTASTFRINGRVFTNSNLMVAGKNSTNKIIFYQVSDPDSCYYEQENSKIVVGGNIANGDFQHTTDQGQVEVHRFRGKGTSPAGRDNTEQGISTRNKTTTQAGGKWVGYNNEAYSQRIGLMVQAALNLHFTRDKPYPTIRSVSEVPRYPQEVKERFKQRFNDANETKDQWKILREELENYFKAHTRRVPYAEVPSSSGSVNALGNYTVANVLGFTNQTIRPPDNWMLIEDPTIASTSGYTNLPLKFGSPQDFDSSTMYLQTTEPTQQKDGQEHFIGDRIVVGNNLPFFWPKYTTNGIYNKFFNKFAEQQEEQLVTNGSSTIYWTNPDSGKASNIQRTRQSQLQMLPDLGSVERDGFWETEAAKSGLRVVTGAGIYIDKIERTVGGTGVRSTDSFLSDPQLNLGVTEPPKFKTATLTNNNNNIIVWPDSLPMRNNEIPKGDLQMRATAVYHYKQALTTNPGEVDRQQIPIACVSSYYDPTDETTARNYNNLPDVSGIQDRSVVRTNGQSNNGVTYEAPYRDDSGRISAVNIYRNKLNRQAMAIFPTGQIVNQSLRNALIKIDARDNENPRSLADNAAIDTSICALRILDDTLKPQASYPNVPHGAIKEATFLDSRQVKSLHNLGSDNTKIAEKPADLTARYTLPLEQRQPLEIRVTELDLNLLKSREFGRATNNINNDSANDQEYVLPNSGIIYATRDDALPDLTHNSTDITTQELVSPTDFKLDSRRRPNGIRLINGANLARKNFYRVAEKGLILATNLPTYIKSNFNLHKDSNSSSSTVREEFIDRLDEFDWNDFYNRTNTPDQNFACRQYQPGCADSGDQWRSATIISDAQTLLSNNFRDGFRNQGDYDLNNNQGNSAASSRRKQGFWNNNFVTSVNWAGSNGYPSYQNSYLTNGVTPIQRRVNNFPEYVMEICRKLPVSECKPNDWVVGFDADGNGTLSEEELNKRVTDILGTPSGGRAGAGAGGGAGGGAGAGAGGGAGGGAGEGAGGGAGEGAGAGAGAGAGGGAGGGAGARVVRPAGALVSGTTARLAGDLTEAALPGRPTPPARPEDQRYARRVAFKRDRNGTLELQELNEQPIPIPIGINAAGNVDEFPYETYVTKRPREANNALWFRTTSNTNGKPGETIDITYENNKPLSYLTPEQGGEKLILPNTLCFNNTSIVECSTTGLQPGVVNLNYPTTDKPSDYTACLDGGNSKEYKVKRVVGTGCSRDTRDTIAHAVTQISNFVTGGYDRAGGFTVIGAGGSNVINGGTVKATAPVVVYDLPASTVQGASNLTLRAGSTQPDAIFVLRTSGSFTFGIPGVANAAGVTITLDGVSPNNVFWVNTSGSTTFQNAQGEHQAKGNFLGNSSALTIGTNTKIDGRLLGFTTALNSPPQGFEITAVTSDGQPSLVPVLQIHSPTGNPGSNPFAGALEDKWLQVATTTTANAAFITGDSPSRPNPSESGGGLQNLVRFLENWDRQTARISGSFMQHTRSSYASAPFNPVDPTITEASASLFYTLEGNRRAPYSDRSDTGFRYRGGASEHRASFFMPPTTRYSFDVALLSQSPDLFAQKFTVNPTSGPSEYFREVGQDDSWIQTLLCAAQGSGTSYTYAIDSNGRPSGCLSLSAYND